MPIKEEAEVTYVTINGKKVPQVKCETEVILRKSRIVINILLNARLVFPKCLIF